MKTFTTGFALLASVLGAHALSVDLDRALNVGENWLAGQPDCAGRVIESWSSRELEGRTTLWLLELQPEGFLLVSGDDRARPVVGWSATGQLPQDFSHPAVSGYLNSVDHAILESATAIQDASILAEWQNLESGAWQQSSRDVLVQPLLSCTWDQGSGWNDLCPVDAAGPGGHALAGCVAVSMAQVMHFWNQPLTGTGSHGYQSDYGYLSVDFEDADYDWNEMSNSNPVYEVQEILYHCGVAVNMGYGADGSGAWVGWGYPSATTAMQDHFGYNSGTHFEERQDYSNAQWHMLMRLELDEGRPMVYRGYGAAGGHAFNLDGYRDDDYFHFNWGWSGSFNGWFLLSNLSPGGSSFNEGQAAIMGLTPDEYQHAPESVTPLDGDNEVICAPATFTWSSSPGASSYEIMIDDAPDFSFPNVQASGLTTTSFNTDELQNFSTYYWRVRASGELGLSPWSPTTEFVTEYWQTTPTPEQATPVDGMTGFNVDPSVFVWAFVSGAESYGLQVADNPDFTTPLVDESGIVENYQVLQEVLEMDQEYWWRVNCIGLAGSSDWSEARYIQTESATSLDQSELPAEWSLGHAWPNPFNPQTSINLILPANSEVDVRVFDLSGREVGLLANGVLPAGEHRLDWRPEGLSSGLYLLKAVVEGSGLEVRKLTLVR